MTSELREENDDMLNKILAHWRSEEIYLWDANRLRLEASFDIGYLFGTIALLREALKED